MLRFFIDSQEVDIDTSTSVALTLSIASITAVERGDTGYSRTLSIPATARNRAVVRHCDDLLSASLFGEENHTGRVEEDGFVLFEGPIVLSSSELQRGGRYSFHLLGATLDWVESASAPLSTLPIDYSREISAQTIAESWTDDVPVRFLPVRRDTFRPENSDVSIYPPARVLTASDYHPFLHVATVVEKIFEEAGYTLHSKFLSDSLFRSLYMSGHYAERDVSLLVAAMDFRAGRYGSATAYADAEGRVRATPLTNSPSVGNLVDTADPNLQNAAGKSVAGAFDNGHCFGTDESGRICFTPTEPVAVSFCYRLRYKSSYRILSADRLAGFDCVRLGPDDLRSFVIANPFPDRKENFRSGFEYRVVLFDHLDGGNYRLYATEMLPSGTQREIVVAEFVGPTALIHSPATINTYSDLRIGYLAGDEIVAYDGEWALYDGSVAYEGEREVELTLTGRPQRVSRSAPAYFDTIAFEGAESGMKLTLLQGTTIIPLFNPHPTEGSVVTFADVARHSVSRLTLLAALRQMFNLYFYTDPIARKVYVEPRSDFYTRRDVDWSHKVDFSRPVVVEELGCEVSQEMVWRYAEGDGAVARYDSANGVVLGSWTAHVANSGASATSAISRNPFFTPSLSVSADLDCAPSAVVVSAGDRRTLMIGSDDLNFPCKVVRYCGLAELPEGEVWDWPSYSPNYPFAAFHDGAGHSGERWTLGFEDRDGAVGLHRFWDENVAHYNEARRLTLYLRLEPADIEPIVVPDRLGHDFRARYIIALGGERSLYRLEAICDYDPAAPSTKCRFVQII